MIRRMLALALLSASAMIHPLCAATGQVSLPREIKKAAVDATAMQVLQRMADTYAHLPSLHQKSLYSAEIKNTDVTKEKADPQAAADKAQSTGSDATAPTQGKVEAGASDDDPNRETYRSVEMLYTGPNLLKITDTIRGDTNPVNVSAWVCDGKSFYAYEPHSHGTDSPVFTQEKAPRNLRAFQNLQFLDAGSLELVMMMGINPFQNLNTDVATARLLPQTTVRNATVDVVSIDSVNPREHVVLKLYIGTEDHLLRRFVSDTTPTKEDGVARIGDALDEMDADPNNSSASHGKATQTTGENPADIPTRASAAVHTVYDNITLPLGDVSTAAFAFKPPDGSSLFRPLGSKQAIDPNSKRLMDIIKKSKNAHGKAVHDVKPIHDITP